MRVRRCRLRFRSIVHILPLRSILFAVQRCTTFFPSDVHNLILQPDSDSLQYLFQLCLLLSSNTFPPHPGPTKREQRLLRSWLLPKFKISLLKLQDCQIISSTPMRYCRTVQPTGDMVEHQTTRILERSIMRVRFSMPLGK